eukprot:6183984-Pleurochrysis_carterae.AAC.1
MQRKRATQHAGRILEFARHAGCGLFACAGAELGSGSFSTVKFCKHIQRGQPASNWPEYAAKVAPPASLSSLSTSLRVFLFPFHLFRAKHGEAYCQGRERDRRAKHLKAREHSRLTTFRTGVFCLLLPGDPISADARARVRGSGSTRDCRFAPAQARLDRKASVRCVVFLAPLSIFLRLTARCCRVLLELSAGCLVCVSVCHVSVYVWGWV